MIEQNRAIWNQALRYHQQARNHSLQKGFASPAFTTFDRDCDAILLDKLLSLNLSGAMVAQLPCNNGRELLSLIRLGAKSGVGFDLSDVAIEEARQLAEIARADATFERINILEISAEYNDTFDFIYISEGSLQWFPDLNDYFAVVSRLLKPSGKILLFEIHPIAYMFDYDFDKQNYDSLVSYFDKRPHSYPNGLDYVGGKKYESSECFSFLHKISDIINAILQSGITIQSFEEYNLEMENNESALDMDKFPLSYLIVGEKKEA
jgi:SAM-dependent methyltransferase